MYDSPVQGSKGGIARVPLLGGSSIGALYLVNESIGAVVGSVDIVLLLCMNRVSLELPSQSRFLCVLVEAHFRNRERIVIRFSSVSQYFTNRTERPIVRTKRKVPNDGRRTMGTNGPNQGNASPFIIRYR
jgi:hypothetical protein